MNDSTILIGLLSVTGGLFGGFVNFMLLSKNEWGDSAVRAVLRSVLSGAAAGLVVPLFLLTIQSGIMDRAKEDTIHYLGILGFGVLAGLFSKAFLETMASRALKLAEQANEKAKKATERTAWIESSETEPEADIPSPHISLEKDEQTVLKSISSPNFKFRNFQGLSREAGLSTTALKKALEGLCSQKLLGTIKKEEGIYYFLTAQGRQYLSPANTDESKSVPTP
jgi:hypothetical protein